MTRSNHTTARNGPSQRQLRIGELIRHVLADILSAREIHDPVLQNTAITVTQVSVSPDTRHATAYVMPLGGDDQANVVAALGKARKYIRGRLGKEISLKFTPEIHFELDGSFDAAAEINQLLNTPKVRRDLKLPTANAAD